MFKIHSIIRLIIGFTTMFVLAGCFGTASRYRTITAVDHCPIFQTNAWTPADISVELKKAFTDKQNFAIGEGYRTLWFRSIPNRIGLCIIPPKKQRGKILGCNSAYAIYRTEENEWKVTMERVVICRK